MAFSREAGVTRTKNLIKMAESNGYMYSSRTARVVLDVVLVKFVLVLRNNMFSRFQCY